MTMNWSFNNLNDRMEVLFQLYLWDQSHVTVVWNTRETGDIYYISTISERSLAIDKFWK